MLDTNKMPSNFNIHEHKVFLKDFKKYSLKFIMF